MRFSFAGWRDVFLRLAELEAALCSTSSSSLDPIITKTTLHGELTNNVNARTIYCYNSDNNNLRFKY